MCAFLFLDSESELPVSCSLFSCTKYLSLRNATMIYHALIRTHRISSKKKIRSLRAAAAEHDVGDLIHVGVPGIMYVSGAKEDGVQSWVDHVHELRY